MSALLGNVLIFISVFVDRILIRLMDLFYNLLFNIASINIVSSKAIKDFNARIGFLLGIFMLFSLAIHLLNYIISPDKASDNSKGGGKLIFNIVISLTLLVTINSIFNLGYNVQKKVLESSFIDKLIFGVASNSDDEDKIPLSYFIYATFVHVNPDVDTSGVCSDVYFTDDIYPCINFLRSEVKLDSAGASNFETAIEDKSALKLMNVDNLSTQKNGKDVFDYVYIFSCIISIVVVLVLISFCLDLAKRCIKLYFYQIIAPLPIISNMIPGKGEDTFKKWYKSCFTTYLDVYIRLIALDFAIYLIYTVYDNASIRGLLSSNRLLGLFIIIGALMFAKELPQLIQDLTGLKLDGNFTLNPLKKLENEMALSGLVGAGVAGARSFAANTIVRGKENIPGGINDIKGYWRGANTFNRKWTAAKATVGRVLGDSSKIIGSGIAGGLSASTRGVYGSVFKGEKLSDVNSRAYSNAMKARINRDERKKYDISQMEIWENKFQRSIYDDTLAEKQDSEVKVYDEFTSAGDSLVSISESEVQKYANNVRLSDFGGSVTIGSETYSTLGELREATSDMKLTAAQRAYANSEYERLKGDVEKQYRLLAASGGSAALHGSTEFSFIDANDLSGANAKVYADNMLEIFDKNSSKDGFKGMTVGSILGNTKQATKSVKHTSITVKNSAEFKHAHVVQEQTNKESKK